MCCQTNNRCTSTIAASKTHQILHKSPAVASLLHVPAVPGVAVAAPLRDKGDHRCEPPPNVKHQTSLILQKSRTTLKQTIRFCLIWITAPGGLLGGTSTYCASFPGAAPIGYCTTFQWPIKRQNTLDYTWLYKLLGLQSRIPVEAHQHLET